MCGERKEGGRNHTSGRCSTFGPASNRATVIEESSARRLATAKPLDLSSVKSQSKIVEQKKKNHIRVTSANDDKVIGRRLIPVNGICYPSQV